MTNNDKSNSTRFQQVDILTELLSEQVNAASKVIANSRAISQHLVAQGISIEIAKPDDGAQRVFVPSDRMAPLPTFDVNAPFLYPKALGLHEPLLSPEVRTSPASATSSPPRSGLLQVPGERVPVSPGPRGPSVAMTRNPKLPPLLPGSQTDSAPSAPPSRFMSHATTEPHGPGSGISNGGPLRSPKFWQSAAELRSTVPADFFDFTVRPGDFRSTSSRSTVYRQKQHSRLLRGNTLFPDAMTIKAMLTKPSWRIEEKYKEDGCWQAIARSHTFELVTFMVICLNCIWIGIATDYDKADVIINAPLWVQIVEQMFCTFFSFELLVRFFAFRFKRDVLIDAWFCFDAFLVFMMAFEDWIQPCIYLIYGAQPGGSLGQMMILRIFRISRVVRLTRIARIVRLLRGMPELMILSKALMLAMRSVGATLMLLVVGIYVFSIFFTEMLSGTEEGKGQFENVLQGMHTLLVYGILADQTDLINAMLETSVFHYAAILVYMLVVSIAMTDMLIGVISEIIESVAKVEKEQMRKEDVNHTIQRIRTMVDMDNSNTVSKQEFGSMLRNEEVVHLIHNLEVDIISLVSFCDVIFENGDDIHLDDFIMILMGFRGQEPVLKRDFDMKKFMQDELKILRDNLKLEISQARETH